MGKKKKRKGKKKDLQLFVLVLQMARLNNGFSLARSSALNMQVIRSPETSLYVRTTIQPRIWQK
jgi:hypothetical protein